MKDVVQERQSFFTVGGIESKLKSDRGGEDGRSVK